MNIVVIIDDYVYLLDNSISQYIIYPLDIYAYNLMQFSMYNSMTSIERGTVWKHILEIKSSTDTKII